MPRIRHSSDLTQGERNYLKRIYFDPRNPASFSGVETVYRQGVKDGQVSLNRKKIRRWIQSNEAYSFSRKVQEKFKRNRVVVSGIDDQWDADLFTMQDYAESNDGITFILCVIDIFSRFAWVRLLKNKESRSVAEQFEDILGQSGRKPRRLRSDRGSEFTGRNFQNMCKRENIIHFTTYNEKQANFVERFIQTYKLKLFSYIVKSGGERYIEAVQNIVESYNNKFHTGIQKEPSQVDKEDEKRLWWQMYLPEEFYNPPEKRKRIRSVQYKYEVGDHVKMAFTISKFTRRYDQRWSTEIFTISSRFNRYRIPLYTLKDQLGEKVAGTFYENELQRVDFDPNQDFKIERIIQYKGRRPNRSALIKWKGWPKKFNSWVKESEIHDS